MRTDRSTYTTATLHRDEAESVESTAVGGLAPGTRVGGYVVVEELARGGMGIVYRALQPSLGREVALKLLPAHLLDDEDLAARFLREARAAGALSHEHLVRIYDAGVHARGAWFTMELVQGTNLRRELEAAPGGRLAPERALEVAVGVASALEALAAGGVVHRDVKPENVLLAPDGQLKLADLGLARAGRSDLTLDGDFLGTPAYIPPEQAVDPRLADARSDLWSLGATLFHALFGRPPFAGRSNVDVLQQTITREVRLPREAARLPSAVRAALRGLLARRPDDRFQSPTEARAALERGLTALRARRTPRKRARRVAAPIASLGVLLAAVLGLTLGVMTAVCPCEQLARIAP
jgi:serine/threonine-protein kinase